MAEIVGNLSLRTDAAWRMIAPWRTPPQPTPGRDRRLPRRAEPRRHRPARGVRRRPAADRGRRAAASAATRCASLSRDGAPLRTSSGLRIAPHARLPRAPAAIDTLIVAGGAGHVDAAADDRRSLDWIARASRSARRTASVCTGRVPARRAPGCSTAAARPRTGRRPQELQRAHPQVRVDRRADLRARRPDLDLGGRHRRHGPRARARRGGPRPRRRAARSRATSCCSCAAPATSRSSAPRSPRSSPSASRCARSSARVLEDVAGEHSVEAMAARAHMSPRHFARAFRAETGVTPARYVERVRLEAARRRLEDTSEPVARDRRRVRLRHRRDDAPRVPAHARTSAPPSTAAASTRTPRTTRAATRPRTQPPSRHHARQ